MDAEHIKKMNEERTVEEIKEIKNEKLTKREERKKLIKKEGKGMKDETWKKRQRRGKKRYNNM